MDRSVDLNVEVIDGCTVIKPNNSRLDASVAPSFKSQVDELITEGNQRVVLDLENVEFMDSSGLGTIVAC